jgi:RNA polymerase sigma factor (sigma-70 family)
MALDPDDISRLYEAHAADLLRFFARRTLQADVAVDLVAETFCQAFTDRAGFRGGDSEALGWIFGIARHQLSGYFRRGSVERRALTRLGLQLPSMSDLDYERVEELAGLQNERAAVADALSDLTVEQREALELRVVQERSYAEVASSLGITEQTARSRVSRALRALAETTAQPEGRPDNA